MTAWLLLGFVLAATPPPADAPKTRKMTAEEKKAFEKKLVTAINAGGPGIDGCVARYSKEYPQSDGTVRLNMTVGLDGRVSGADAQTGLKGARNLRPCLERVAKGLKFPAPKTAKPVQMGISVPVKKGAKFKLYAEGEAPPPKKDEPEPPRVLRFNGGAWFPTAW